MGEPDTADTVLSTALRCVRVTVHFARAWLELTLLFPRFQEHQRADHVQAWCVDFLRIARLQVEPHGAAPAPGPVMLVANHVSWLDMIVLQSLRPTRFVAKSEVRHWPLIGTIATRCGTIYVQRALVRGTAVVAGRIGDVLVAGGVVTLFPEGTTTDGTHVKRFQPSLLQAAVDAAASVQPIGISYFEAASGAACPRVAYVGDDTLAASIWRTLRQQTRVQVRFGEAISADCRHRRELASELQSVVESLRRPALPPA